MKNQVLVQWNELVNAVNGRTTLGEVGVRDPESTCEAFDGQGYDGSGRCDSDGHYLCTECSHLAPDAPRFTEYGAAGRLDRIRLRLRASSTRLGASSLRSGGTDGSDHEGTEPARR